MVTDDSTATATQKGTFRATNAPLAQQLEMVQQLNSAGSKFLQKYKNIKNASQRQHQQSQMSRHKFAWTEEHGRLRSQRREIEGSLCRFYSQNPVCTEHSESNAEAIRDFRDGLQRTLTISVSALRSEVDRIRKGVHEYLDPSSSDKRSEEASDALYEYLEAAQQKLQGSISAMATDQNALQNDIEAFFWSQQSSLAESEDRCVLALFPPAPMSLALELYLEESVSSFRNRFHQHMAARSQVVLELNEFIDSVGEHGGWSEADHSLFVSLEKTYRGKPQKELLSGLRIALQQFSQSQFLEHLQFCRRIRALSLQLKVMDDKWRQEKDEFLEEIAVTIPKISEEEKRCEQLERAAAVLQQKKEETGQRLSFFRKQHDERLAQRQREEEARRKMEEMQRDLQSAKAALRQEEQKAVLRVFHDRREEEESQAALEEAARQEEARREAQERMPQLRERTEFRRQQLEEKRLHERDEAEQRELERRQQQEALDRLRQNVPYRAALESIDRDFDRVVQQTSSSQAEGYRETNIFRTDGYDDETLFRDPKFRLGVALQAAGLHRSEYARDVMIAMGGGHNRALHEESKP